MAEFHKKESEELEKEHDKLYELLEEDKKKVCLHHHLNGSSVMYLTISRVRLRSRDRAVDISG